MRVRLLRTLSLSAKYFARPICPCETRAAKSAITGAILSRLIRTSVTAARDGVRSCRWRQRERMVGRTSCRVGAQSNQTVRVPGSSIALRSALAADSVRRSASSITTTRQPPIDGAHAMRVRSSRTSSTLIDRPSVRMISTSGWPLDAAERQSLQVPQPILGQIRAWAKATAADERPEPGGPVKTQACVISCDSSPVRLAATAPLRISVMCS